MPSSTVYHTQTVPRHQDWYYDLHAVIPLFHVLSKPPPSNLSSEPTYKSCHKGHLLCDITDIHAAIVSSFLFLFLLSWFNVHSFQVLQAACDPNLMDDLLVSSFASSVGRIVLALKPENVPEAWSVWFHREDAEAPKDVHIFSIHYFLCFLKHFVSQPDDMFDWLDVFPYRKGDPIVEQEDVFLLPVTQPLHNDGPVSGPPVKIGPPSSLKRPCTCLSSSFLLFIILLLRFPL
jgi:hypothetical protein